MPMTVQSKHYSVNIQTRTTADYPEFHYHMAAPSCGAQGLPVLVAVHGISHRAKEQIRAFLPYVEQYRFVLIAPLFCRKNFPAYQRLGVSRQTVPCYPDIALNSLLDEVSEYNGASTRQVYLFGYSAGGQFVHRYAMTYPEKVHAVTMGAAGWYTFPDKQAPFPRGLRARRQFRSLELNPSRFLKVPMATFVGELDIDHDDTFKRSPRLDLQQGLNRVERAERWAQAMHDATQMYGFDTCYQSYVMPACGHSFADCVEHGNLANKAVEFLFEASQRQQTVTHSRLTILTQPKTCQIA
jgi:pimeloyl-ACP methyl ester carboxylesterase